MIIINKIFILVALKSNWEYEQFSCTSTDKR